MDDKYRDNVVHNANLLDQLRERMHVAQGGGGADAVQKHRARGKLTVRERIAMLVDPESEFLELASLAAWDMYDNVAPGAGMVTGVGMVSGVTCMIGNNGILFSEGALKAVHFIQLCEKRGTPLLFLQNIPGFMVGKHFEEGDIAKHGAKLVTAVATTRVPMITIMTGGSFGAGNYAMAGRAYDPRFLFSWPNSRISVMGGQQASKVLSQVKVDQLNTQGRTLGEREIEELERPIVDSYEREGSPYFSSARLWNDGIISPLETRKVVGQCLAAVQCGHWSNGHGFGLFRM